LPRRHCCLRRCALRQPDIFAISAISQYAACFEIIFADGRISRELTPIIAMPPLIRHAIDCHFMPSATPLHASSLTLSPIAPQAADAAITFISRRFDIFAILPMPLLMSQIIFFDFR
jgi:hypothetical protein